MSTISAIQNQIDPLTGLVGGTSAASSGSTSSSKSTGGLATESTFLTLLVAQLKNQDPEQPADGTAFVTQLAQFTTLEQNLAMRTDLDSINTKTPAVPATTPATSGTTSGSAAGSNGSISGS